MMNISTDSRPQLLRILVELAREMPPGTLSALTSALDSEAGAYNLDRFAATPMMRDKLRKLEESCSLQLGIDAKAIALALQAAAEAAGAATAEHRTEIAWTGPATESVPLRRVDQAIYDMVESASEEVLLVTFAAYKAERALKALRTATDHGVGVRLVIELAQESGGKLSFDGLQAIRSAVPSAQIFYWPLERRKHRGSGPYGSMHAKCLIADRKRAIVSSANLTDYALEANKELGLLVESAIASRLADHFDQLIVRGELAPVR